MLFLEPTKTLGEMFLEILVIHNYYNMNQAAVRLAKGRALNQKEHKENHLCKMWTFRRVCTLWDVCSGFSLFSLLHTHLFYLPSSDSLLLKKSLFSPAGPCVWNVTSENPQVADSSSLSLSLSVSSVPASDLYSYTALHRVDMV